MQEDVSLVILSQWLIPHKHSLWGWTWGSCTVQSSVCFYNHHAKCTQIWNHMHTLLLLLTRLPWTLGASVRIKTFILLFSSSTRLDSSSSSSSKSHLIKADSRIHKGPDAHMIQSIRSVSVTCVCVWRSCTWRRCCLWMIHRKMRRWVDAAGNELTSDGRV